MNGKSTVLIIDDDVTLLKMASRLLEENYAVSLAKSGQEALDLLKQGLSPDIILLDIDMPEMDGYETIEQLHALPRGPDIPVIFLTGVTETKAELKGFDLGAVDYITKPFVKEILLRRLGAHLENARKWRVKAGQKRRPNPLNPLTPWEREIALHLKQWLTAAQIAERMGTTENTIRTATKSIYQKLNIHSKGELADIEL
jgi:CheY-like chemotaxis protein/DNA-binding CsgD family transcriptional regulator